ncbi:Thioesterase/thiol ester dehydrase-isomerase [Plenodomus tracheiphilus IPT5]|uniref:Thioesterase/thiol ester dehydrase-isomerase n=1 Tax=Plenodomus tracheiphilus IPT5 TaxID=1408161 RepID=A0A6A7BPH4_9PLEO|nr:Thioesterase/thiol ester dehydrase-isomerase [Plenodomus tracheiphilus IPT5]
MFSARIALSRHVGRRSGCSAGVVVVVRREVGGAAGSSIRGNGSAPWRRSIVFEKGILGRQVQIRERSTVIESNNPHSQSSPPPPPPKADPLNSNTTPPPPPPQPKKPIYIRLPLALALTLLTFAAGFTMAGTPAIAPIRALSNPPTDAETLELYSPPTPETATIESSIWNHPLTKRLLQDPKYIASRPHLKIPEQLRAQNLTGGTLLGEDKIAVPPLQFTTQDGSSFVSIQYLGSALCGHPGIVHGGLLATLLDEGLARCCFPALPNKVGVTAKLDITYKAPVMAGQVVVLRAETTKVEGRKAWVRGWLETLVDEAEGEKAVVLTEGEALFVEPRQAAQMRRVVV